MEKAHKNSILSEGYRGALEKVSVISEEVLKEILMLSSTTEKVPQLFFL